MVGDRVNGVGNDGNNGGEDCVGSDERSRGEKGQELRPGSFSHTVAPGPSCEQTTSKAHTLLAGQGVWVMEPVGQKSVLEAHGFLVAASSQKKPKGQIVLLEDPVGQYSLIWHETGVAVPRFSQRKPAGHDGQSFFPLWL